MAPSKRVARRRPVEDDEEEQEVRRPSKRVARPAPREESEAPDDADDDDEAPRKPRKAAAANTSLRGGWTDAQKQMDSTSDFAQSLKLDEKSVFIKFLEDTPYVNFRRHWVERVNQGGQKSNRAYTCLQTIDKDCPLCEVGDRAQAVAAFNVALIGDDGQVLLKSWDVGPRLFNVLKAYNGDAKIGPLTKGYFMVSRSGKKGTAQYNVSSVSRTALSEDYDIEPPAQAELNALVQYTPEIVQIPKLKEMRELADELADEYE